MGIALGIAAVIALIVAAVSKNGDGNQPVVRRLPHHGTDDATRSTSTTVPSTAPSAPPTPSQPSERAIADATTIAQQAGAGAAADAQHIANQAAALNREVAEGRMTVPEAQDTIRHTGETLNQNRATQTQQAQAAALVHETQRVQSEVAAGHMTAQQGKTAIQTYTTHLRNAASGQAPPPHPVTVARGTGASKTPSAQPAAPPPPPGHVPATTHADALADHEAIDRQTRQAAAQQAAQTPRTLPDIPAPGADQAAPAPPPPPPPPPSAQPSGSAIPAGPPPPPSSRTPRHQPRGYLANPENFRLDGGHWYEKGLDGQWYHISYPGQPQEHIADAPTNLG